MTPFNAPGGSGSFSGVRELAPAFCSRTRIAVGRSRRGTACCARPSNSQVRSVSPRRSPFAPTMTNNKLSANWPAPAFRSAGVPPALLTFSSTGQTVGLTQRMLVAAFAVPGSRRGAACCARSINSRTHTDSPRPAFRSAGVPPALLTFSKDQLRRVLPFEDSVGAQHDVPAVSPPRFSGVRELAPAFYSRTRIVVPRSSRGAACCGRPPWRARPSNSQANSDWAGFPSAAGSDKETFYVVGSYLTTGTRARIAVVCRAGGKNDL